MTEKLLTFPSLLPTPSPTSPDPGDGVNRSEFNFFPEQHQHKPTIKTFVQGQHARIQEFFARWGGGMGGGDGGGGGPGSSTYFTVNRGGPMALLHNTRDQTGSFEHPKHMFKLMDKKIITILCSKTLLNP